MFKTIKIQTTLNDHYKIAAQIRDHHVIIDQPKEAGGTNTGPTPLEYFLFSIAGCVLSIARIVATQKKITLRGMSVNIEGDIDVARLLGKPTDSRAGFQEIRMNATLDADLTLDEKKEFLKEVEERCPVAENIKEATTVELVVVEQKRKTLS